MPTPGMADRRTRPFLLRWLRRAALGVLALLALALVGRAVQARLGPPLASWHLVVPPEPGAAELARLGWPQWIAAEERAFAAVASQVAARLEAGQRNAANRFYEGSPLHPARFGTDWNRSYRLDPAGPPRGVVLLLHGLTDAPFSLRHLAEAYRGEGFVALGMRMPGHGTAPGGLTQARWQDWVAAAHLGMREARRIAGGKPVHVVGYSNGGALALMQALDALERPELPAPERIVLVSPMIGVSAAARLAWLAALPAALPWFPGAAWLTLLPEFNPFKYNSFPVNAAVQSDSLSRALQGRLAAAERGGVLARLPPVLTFQSVLDFTVSTEAVIGQLYARLPAGGHELVLFDRNRATPLALLLRPALDQDPQAMVGPAPRRFRFTLVTNEGQPRDAMVVLSTPQGGREAESRPLAAAFPRGVLSLSHVALPFPESDSLYGSNPAHPEEFGVNLGGLTLRGETGISILAPDSLNRITWNPFFDWMAGRILEGVAR